MVSNILREMDEAQDHWYNAFLSRMGLEHTEKNWNVFSMVWNAGKDWGHEIETTL